MNKSNVYRPKGPTYLPNTASSTILFVQYIFVSVNTINIPVSNQAKLIL